MKKIISIFFFFLVFINLPAQNIKYKASEITDSIFGITIYEKLNLMLGGDSIRVEKGYACQGWVTDYYQSNKILHKGYYVDGKLKIYKNYYENGMLERSFKVSDAKRGFMQINFYDGKLKSEIDYFEGNPQRWKDFYNNGQLEFIEEYNKKMDYCIQRKSFMENGNPISVFELTDQRKKIYSKKEYYENGKIKEEGSLMFNPNSVDYQKEDIWKNYNEKGKLISEDIYVNGGLTKSTRY